MKEESFRSIIIKGFKLLRESYAYSQATVVRKMKAQGLEVSKPTFNNIMNDKDASLEMLHRVSLVIREVVESELGYCYDEKKLQYKRKPLSENWKPYIIPVESPNSVPSRQKAAVFYPKGRWTIEQKVAFMSDAQEEITEMGVRLNTFANYFTTRNEYEFKLPLYKLLERGVNFHAYLLNPNCNEARLYFNDRASVQAEEKDSLEKINAVIKKLEKVIDEINSQGFKGDFNIYMYKHIPYAHYLIVDGERKHAKLAVSPYLYGITRANCPVIEIEKQSDRSLYRRYYHSFKYLAKDARSI